MRPAPRQAAGTSGFRAEGERSRRNGARTLFRMKYKKPEHDRFGFYMAFIFARGKVNVRTGIRVRMLEKADMP